MTPRERIRQAEREIETSLQEVLRRLATDIDMVPSGIDIDMIDATTFNQQSISRMTLVGPVRLRF